jgi:hypothetical protein
VPPRARWGAVAELDIYAAVVVESNALDAGEQRVVV